MNEPIRLSKRLAAQLPCSRSEAEQYIEGGWVRVDGRVVDEPHFRVLHEKVELDPAASLSAPLPVTLLLHQPAGPGASRQLPGPASHWQGDPSGIRVLKRHFSHLTPVMALDPAASGLLVYTQDARVARKLSEDAHLVELETMVDVQGAVGPDTLALLRRGAPGEPEPLQFKVSTSSSNAQRSTLRFAVKGARAGLLVEHCARAGLQVLAQRRLRIGRVALGPLPPGQWRYLQAHERF